MSIGRLITYVLLGAAATLAVAVRRDTIVRRWLLPASPEAAALAKLDLVLPTVRVPRTSISQAAARVGELAGVPVEVDWTRLDPGGLLRERAVELDLRNVTVRDVLRPLTHLLSADVRADGGRLVIGVPPAGWRVRTCDLRPATAYAAEAAELGPARDAVLALARPGRTPEAEVIRLVDAELFGYGSPPQAASIGVVTLVGGPPIPPAAPAPAARAFGRYAVVSALAGDHLRVERLLAGLARPNRPGVVTEVSDPFPAVRQLAAPIDLPEPPEGPLDGVLAGLAGRLGLHLFADWDQLEAMHAVWPDDVLPNDPEAARPDPTGLDAFTAAVLRAQASHPLTGYPAVPVAGAGGVVIVGADPDPRRVTRVYDVADMLGERILRERSAAAGGGPRPAVPPDVIARRAELSLRFDLWGRANAPLRRFGYVPDALWPLRGREVLWAEPHRHVQFEQGLAELRRAAREGLRP